MHAYIHTYTHTYIHAYIHTYIHYITLHYITLHYITLHYITLHYITLHTYIHILTYTYTYIHIYVYMYVYICIYIYVYIHIYIYICIYCTKTCSRHTHLTIPRNRRPAMLVHVPNGSLKVRAPVPARACERVRLWNECDAQGVRFKRGGCVAHMHANHVHERPCCTRSKQCYT